MNSKIKQLMGAEDYHFCKLIGNYLAAIHTRQLISV